jgi:hypothetical protein
MAGVLGQVGCSVIRPGGVGRRPLQRSYQLSSGCFSVNLAAGVADSDHVSWGRRGLEIPKKLGSIATGNAKWACKVAEGCQQDKGRTSGQVLTRKV